MSCELYTSQIYAWREDGDADSFQPLFDHLVDCPDCAKLFDRVTSDDQTIQRTFWQIPKSPALESRILTGLVHQRAQDRFRRGRWRFWLLLPLAASILIGVALGIRPRLQEVRFAREVAGLLSKPPALQINSIDQRQLLNWSSNVLTGLSSLPPELDRVEFKGATALSVADHKAVLLKMKNEQRASLLIVDALFARDQASKPLYEKSGSVSVWSDGRRTYVLLYEGSIDEMRAYMTEMGIST